MVDADEHKNYYEWANYNNEWFFLKEAKAESHVAIAIQL